MSIGLSRHTQDDRDQIEHRGLLGVRHIQVLASCRQGVFNQARPAPISHKSVDSFRRRLSEPFAQNPSPSMSKPGVPGHVLRGAARSWLLAASGFNGLGCGGLPLEPVFGMLGL